MSALGMDAGRSCLNIDQHNLTRLICYTQDKDNIRKAFMVKFDL